VNILLVNPPSTCLVPKKNLSYFDHLKKRVRKSSEYRSFPVEHLGLLQLKAYLKSKEVHVDIVNGQIDCHKNLKETFLAIEKSFEKNKFDAVGLTGTSVVWIEIIELAKFIKEISQEIVIILAGHFPSLNPKRILRTSN